MNIRSGSLGVKEQQVYLDGLKKFEEKGIPIYIDGEVSKEEDRNRIFEVHEDGSFYMGDYVGAEQGKLKEIHFDRVYNR